jgi:hypothetical protein
MGRPVEYDEAIFTELMERLASGETLRAICESQPDRYPSSWTVRRWVIDDLHGVYARYTRAREQGMHEMIDETITISDDSSRDTMIIKRGDDVVEAPDHEWMARSRLRVDTRKWLASKILPKIFGDRLEVESKSTVTHEIGDSVTGLISRIRTERNVAPLPEDGIVPVHSGVARIVPGSRTISSRQNGQNGTNGKTNGNGNGNGSSNGNGHH